MKYKVELSYNNDNGSWWTDVEVEASNEKEAGEKARAESSHLEFYQTHYGPPPSRVSVQQVYSIRKKEKS